MLLANKTALTPALVVIFAFLYLIHALCNSVLIAEGVRVLILFVIHNHKMRCYAIKQIKQSARIAVYERCRHPYNLFRAFYEPFHRIALSAIAFELVQLVKNNSVYAFYVLGYVARHGILNTRTTGNEHSVGV